MTNHTKTTRAKGESEQQGARDLLANNDNLGRVMGQSYLNRIHTSICHPDYNPRNPHLVIDSEELCREFETMEPGVRRAAEQRLLIAAHSAHELACAFQWEETADFKFRHFGTAEEIHAAIGLVMDTVAEMAIPLTVKRVLFDRTFFDELQDGYRGLCRALDRLPGVELQLTAVFISGSPNRNCILICDQGQVERARRHLDGE